MSSARCEVRRLSSAMSVVAIGIILSARSAFGINSIAVESKIATPLIPCTLGVYITNDYWLDVLTLALETRVLDGDAYYDSVPRDVIWNFNENGRLKNSPLGDIPSSIWSQPFIIRDVYPEAIQSPSCSGPASGTYEQPGTAAGGIPPDGFLLFSVVGDRDSDHAIYFDPGADQPGVPSMRFVFPRVSGHGRFIVDTCCIRPANHTGLVLDPDNPHPLTFAAGVVTTCVCDNQGDPTFDGLMNMADVVKAVDISFSNAAQTRDPNLLCLYSPADVDCDGVTGIVDVIRLINVAFRGADPSITFCNPCE